MGGREGKRGSERAAGGNGSGGSGMHWNLSPFPVASLPHFLPWPSQKSTDGFPKKD